MIKKIIQKIKFELQFKNTQYYTRISDRIFKATYQRILEKKIRSLNPIVLNTKNAKLTLAIIANKKRFFESIAALYSFCFWEKNVFVHYHEDGTLSADDIALLKTIFKGITVFTRAEQNQKAKDYLLAKNLSYCGQLRESFLFGIKLIDMQLEKKTPFILHIDSDVLFFSKPHEILDIVVNNTYNGCFNADNVTSYTFDADTMTNYIGKPIIGHFNSGLLLHKFDESFFNFIERVMEKEMASIVSWHLEQTLFAMYATIEGDFKQLPKQYDVGRAGYKLGGLVSEHYCHNTGYDMHKDFIYKLYPQYKG